MTSVTFTYIQQDMTFQPFAYREVGGVAAQAEPEKLNILLLRYEKLHPLKFCANTQIFPSFLYTLL